jgi:hypothetical protein
MVSAMAEGLCIHTGWAFGVASGRGGQGSLHPRSRSVYVLSADELAPEFRAAPSRRRSLARM